MEKIVSILVVGNALTKHVIDSTESVCVMANMVKYVKLIGLNQIKTKSFIVN